MITRMKISGFKNLVDVNVRFGPFTCVAGRRQRRLKRLSVSSLAFRVTEFTSSFALLRGLGHSGISKRSFWKLLPTKSGRKKMREPLNCSLIGNFVLAPFKGMYYM